MIRVQCRCGRWLETDGAARPECPCGSSSIRRVQAPPPRIRGCASGPLVETVELPPLRVNLALGSWPETEYTHE